MNNQIKGGGGNAPSSFNLHHLPGGLRVVTEPIPFVRSVSFGIWVRTGSRNESPTQRGMSHFLEHMLFKGTDKRSAAQIAEEMDAVGGQLNAFTSKESTCYFARVLDTHFDTAFDVLTDMFFNSKLDADEIDKERNVIIEEIAMNEDSPSDLVVDLLLNQIYKGNPLGHSILGTEETVGQFTRQDFAQFMQKNYCPSNTVIAIAGNINEDEVLEKIRTAFAQYTDTNAPEKAPTALYVPALSLRDKDIEQVHLAMGFPGVKWSKSEEFYAMMAANTIFGGGMSSRLFQKVREERGLVYSIYSYNIGYDDTGVFLIYAALNPAHLDDALGLITEETRRLFTDRVTAEQLAKTKEQIKSNIYLSLESSGSRMNSIGSTVLMGEMITPDEAVAKVDAITLDSLYAVSEKIFLPESVSLSLVGKSVEGRAGMLSK
ncbi:MAG: insulinase family protein [Defluviitaleaceae bacterium]|nr:insulinase family protein [Defluviitaleaceae bacterium]